MNTPTLDQQYQQSVDNRQGGASGILELVNMPKINFGGAGWKAVAPLPISACLQDEQANLAARRCTNHFCLAKGWFASSPPSINKISPPEGEHILLVGLDGIEPSTKWL